MTKGRLDINYLEKELPATQIPFNTRNVVALISEYEVVTSPVENVLKIIEQAIEVAQGSTDANAATDVAAISGLPANIATAISGLTTIVEVIQAIESETSQALEDVADDPLIVEPADWGYQAFRSIRDANLELNYTLDEESNVIAPEAGQITAKGNDLIDKMYAIRPEMETILLVNKTVIPVLADQLEIIGRSSAVNIAKDTKWTKQELTEYSIFAQEQKSAMNGVGLIGVIDLTDTDFNNIISVKTNYMNKFDKGGITFMATSPVSVEGMNYSLASSDASEGTQEINFSLEDTTAFWVAYLSGIAENASLSRKIVEPISKSTISTKEYYANQGLNGAETICLECGLIALAQRDIITEQFEVLNSNTPKYYRKLNDYLDMSITRTQNLIMNVVREGLRTLQGNKNKPVSYSAAKDLISQLKTRYVPEYIDNLTITAAKNGSTTVLATIESDYTNIIGTIDVYGYNNIE